MVRCRTSRRPRRSWAGAFGLWLGLCCLLPGRQAQAHPTPFSYLDLLLSSAGLSGMLVVHVYDAAHELGIDPSERLLSPEVAQAEAPRLMEELGARLRLSSEGRR